ncbi:low molecular weight phosphatase family protein [Microbacterium sp. NPDC058345]|uniref:arsenate reductase/protein-tyrosine-phosphatase family protein n=1 Tax=Microbacterium sp. NPDC058345 TaxID=3346455 RepID=UPI0036556D1B
MNESRPQGLTRRELRRRAEALRQPVTHQAQDGAAPTILFVCTGNICRSPMAEILLRTRLEPLGVRVHSAGTHGMVDREMDALSQELTVALGADPALAAAHRARYLTEPMLNEADLILAMTREHRAHAVRMVPGIVRRAFTMREFARWASSPQQADADGTGTAGMDTRSRFRHTVMEVASRRTAGAGTLEDDIIDPYRAARTVYEESAAQLAPALTDVERIVASAVA